MAKNFEISHATSQILINKVKFWFFLCYLITKVMDEYFTIAEFYPNSCRHTDCNFHWNSSRNHMSLELCKNSATNCFQSEKCGNQRSEFCHWSRQHRNSDRNDLKRQRASPASCLFFSWSLF